MSEEKNNKLKKIKNKLIAHKKAVIFQLQKFAQKSKKVKGDYETKFQQIGRHQDENAIEVSNYESSLSVEHELEKELKDIESALKKTSENTYGVCSNCGKQINPKRLEAMPEATLCIECSAKKR